MAAKKETGKGQASVESVREIEITRLNHESATIKIIGMTPFIYNSVPFKAQQVLLAPGPRRKNSAELAQSLKHNPSEEYRNSCYTSRDPASPTRLVIPTAMFKGAMRTAALEMPGVSKAGIGRLIWVGPRVAQMHGVPQLYMSVVRSADQARTPDIRTRAILEEWATEVTVSYVTPQLRAKTVFDLLEAAGLVSGVGDFRQEKGAGNNGQFRIVSSSEDEAEWQSIVDASGRKVQEAALASPNYYDQETEQLMTWFLAEIGRRGRDKELAPVEAVMAGANGKPRAKNTLTR